MRKDEQFAAGARSNADWVGVRPLRPPATDPRIMRVYPPARDPRVGPVIDPRDFAPGLRAGSGDGSPTFSDGGSGGPELDAPESVNLDALAELLRRLADIPAIHDFIASGVLDDIPGYEGIESWDELLTVTGFGGASERGFDALGGASYGGRAGKRNREPGGFGVSRLGLASEGVTAYPNVHGTPQDAQSHNQQTQGLATIPDRNSGQTDANRVPDGSNPRSHDGEDHGRASDDFRPEPSEEGERLLMRAGPDWVYVDEDHDGFADHAYGPRNAPPPGPWDVPWHDPSPEGSPSVADLAALHRLLGYFHPATFWGQQGPTNPRLVRPDRETGPNPWGPRLVVPGVGDEPPKLRARARPLTRDEFDRGRWRGGGPRPVDPARALNFLAEALKRRL